jgi:type II secretory pathway pseudopilin PulG
MQPQQPANRPNTPAGYGQPQHGAPQYGAQPQGNYGQPGMAPPPYPQYPPPKKGLPWWAWLLIVGGIGFVCLMILGILALAAVPLITSNTRDARRSEGEQMLGSMRNQAKVAYAASRFPPVRLTGSRADGGCMVPPDQLAGKYFKVADQVGAPSASEGSLHASPNTTPPGQGVGSDGQGELTFPWQGRMGEQIVWR